MDNRADLVAYDLEGKPALVVEVKNKVGTNSAWAARMRRNILAHGFLPNAPYFLLALPDRFYLWTNKSSHDVEQPSYEVDPAPLLRPYLEKAGIQAENLSNEGLELLVASWLGELLQAAELSEALQKSDGWLIESGLFDAIRHGQILSEFA